MFVKANLLTKVEVQEIRQGNHAFQCHNRDSKNEWRLRNQFSHISYFFVLHVFYTTVVAITEMLHLSYWGLRLFTLFVSLVL